MKILTTFSTLTFLLLITVSNFGQRLIVDPTFTPNINGAIRHVKVLPDQKILITGSFTTVDGQSRLKIARLNADGSLDTTFDANWIYASTSSSSSGFSSLTVQPNGEIYVSGYFAGNNTGMYKIFRLNSNGSSEQNLTTIPIIEGGGIGKIQPLPDGKFFACGYFSTANGNSKPYLARFNHDGSFDPNLTTVLNDDCKDVAVQPDGKYLVAGYFTAVNNSPKLALVRLNSDDSIDTSFNAFVRNNPNVLDAYLGIKLLDDGTMYAFHDPPYVFEPQYSTNVGILRLNADGSIRTRIESYARPATDLEILSNGKIIATGDFFNAGTGSTQGYSFNRFTPDGRHDGSVRVDFFGASPGAETVEIAANEKIIVGGRFTSVRTNGVSVSKNYLVRLMPQPVPIKHKYDFDGDGKDDLAVFRPSDRAWYINQSTNGFTSAQFGLSTDIPVAADYDSDGKADIAVFRNGIWYWMRSSDNTFVSALTGQAGDIPQGGFRGRFYIRGNMNPDGTPGLLTFRPSEAAFYIHNPYQSPRTIDLMGMTVTSNDIPVSADYDGDEFEDVAVFRDGNWSYLSSNDSKVWSFQFGLAGDKPVIGDFDGDGRTDYAVFRPSTGVWWIHKSTEGSYAVQWGLADDLPVPADYDGDGRTDIAVYREGFWYILLADGSYRIEKFGLAGDIPAQSAR